MKWSLANAVLNSLSSHIAVLDNTGTIVAVNDAWTTFAQENGGDTATSYLGVNYLATCDGALCGGGDASAEAMRDGMRAMLQGERDEFALEYPCSSPTQLRWFCAKVRRCTHAGTTYLIVAHDDITARKQAEDTLQATEAALREVLDALPVGVWIMDRSGYIVHCNPAARGIWEGALYVGPERFGEYQGWWLDSGDRIAAEEWAAARAIREGETSIDEEILIECFDGTRKIILNSAIPLRDAAGAISGAICVNQDISTRKQAEVQLHEASAAVEAVNRKLQEVLAREQRNARTDDLTGLGNRRQFFELVGPLFNVAQRYQTPLSIVLLDIDHFKRFNDRFGHHVGDTILQRVARVARRHSRDADVLARHGGEEFIIALPNTAVEGALSLAQSIREDIALNLECVDSTLANVTISAGVAQIRYESDSLDRLIRRADQALYQAKGAGRNCCRVFGDNDDSE